MRKWHKGPPPHIGWWNARVIGFDDCDLWGWWDGVGWSAFTKSDSLHPAIVAKRHGRDYGSTAHVEWSDYYPKNARVKRIKP